MRYIPHIFFSDDVFDPFPEQEDDIDKLFRNLEQVEPPPSVIERILSSVSQLPQPVPPGAAPPRASIQQVPAEAPTEAIESDQSEHDPWSLLDGLVVRKERCEPS
ncbi:MAG TPA: hypothetical protein VKV40_11745 [Ktedonobacteraceae bacterium]|nr:hypothetical protein [Ktedonobacteraceae bacterium]